MNTNRIAQCERTKLEKMSRFQLPHSYKKIGYVLAILSFFLLVVLKSSEIDLTWIRPVLKNLILIGFLIVSLSKESLEDEMIKVLRAKSYGLAFIMGVFYAMVLPFAGYVIDYLLNSEPVLKEANFFEGLLSMLLVQIAFFEVLKRNR